MTVQRKKIFRAVQEAILDWQVNDAELTVQYRVKRPRLLISVITDSVLKAINGEEGKP